MLCASTHFSASLKHVFACLRLRTKMGNLWFFASKKFFSPFDLQIYKEFQLIFDKIWKIQFEFSRGKLYLSIVNVDFWRENSNICEDKFFFFLNIKILVMFDANQFLAKNALLPQFKIPQNLSKKWSLQKRRSCSSSQMTYTWRLITLKSIMNPNGLRKKKAPGPNGPRSPKITLILGVVIWTPQMSEIEQKIASDPLSNHHQHYWDMIKNDRFDLGRCN